MKKTLAVILLLSALSLSAKAQVNIGYGIGAGFSLTSISIMTANYDATLNSGNISGGGFAEFAFGAHFALQGGIDIAGRGARGYSITDLVIPLIAECKFGEEHGFLVYAGPYFNFIMSTSDNVIVGTPDINSYKLGIKPFDLGVKGGIGYQSGNGVLVRFGYELGLGDIASANQYGNKVSYDGITVSLAYLFHKRDRSGGQKRPKRMSSHFNHLHTFFQ